MAQGSLAPIILAVAKGANDSKEIICNLKSVKQQWYRFVIMPYDR